MAVDALRETFHINRVSPEKLEDFLTAQTYRPEITRAKEKIESLTWGELQSFCRRPIRQGKSPTYVDGQGLTCIKPKHTSEMIVSFEETDNIDPRSKGKVAGQRLLHGDIVITRSGAGTIGRASLFLSRDEVYTNDHLFIVRPDDVDAYYTCAFLNTYWGQRLLEAGVSGSTGQLNLSNEHIKSLKLYSPSSAAQKFIGNKIRQAERLRAWAHVLEAAIFGEFSQLVVNPLPARLSWRTSATILDPHRINPKQYDPVVLGLLERARKGGIDLQPLSDLFSERDIAGGATPKGAQYFEEGVLFARVQNVKPLRLDLSDAVYIDSDADDALARSRCISNDIILSITGYPGTASLVTVEDLPVNINQHSVRFGVRSGVSAAYVCAALNSRFVKYQVDRLAIGGTRDALDYPSVRSLLIPRFDVAKERAIDESARDFVGALKLSHRLTVGAVLLVEALIEGAITEEYLSLAQQRLEAGDDQLDREVLARLRADGLDGAGPPLFSDLDDLYALVDQAAQAVQ